MDETGGPSDRPLRRRPMADEPSMTAAAQAHDESMAAATPAPGRGTAAVRLRRGAGMQGGPDVADQVGDGGEPLAAMSATYEPTSAVGVGFARV
jgi:hypothetical protein